AKFADALTHYHKAIELDPSNYQAIYRRATTYLAVGRAKPGLTDLDTVLAQKPDFSGARQQRANVLFKMGKLSEAAHDFQHLIDHAENSKQFADRLWLVEQSQQNTELARHSYEAQDCEHVLETASKLLVEQPWNSELYLMRGHCFEKMGKLKEAIVELRHASKHSTHNMQLLFEISELQYKRAQIRGALSTIRECLKIDPDHKKCYGSYKNLRKVVKSLDAIKSTIDAQAWPKCLSSGEKLLKSHENDVAVRVNVAKMMCQCNRENGNIGAAIGDCNSALEHDEDDVEAWILRAEAYLADEEHDLGWFFFIFFGVVQRNRVESVAVDRPCAVPYYSRLSSCS
uniref:TPR_REGION domain-containing protein n=1 Tax=Caenorhabditis japonica TaxID=281687 RepID=A0A8R1EQ88_CAEJA